MGQPLLRGMQREVAHCCRLCVQVLLHGGHEADTEDDTESATLAAVNSVRRHRHTSRAGSATSRAISKSECSAGSEHGGRGKPAEVADEVPANVPAAPVVAAPPTVGRTPVIDSTRIESWVAESQRAIENQLVTSCDDLEENEVDEVPCTGDAHRNSLAHDQPSTHENIVDDVLNGHQVDEEINNGDEEDGDSMKTGDEGCSVASSNSNYVQACDGEGDVNDD